MLSARKIVAVLKAQKISHVVGLPDNGSRCLFEVLITEETIEVIPVTREGEAMALAAGLYLGGARPLVLIQNTGFLETGDAFRGTVFNMGVPLVMLIGYRGYASMDPGAERVDTAATFLEPTLKAWGVPYGLMHTDDDLDCIDEAFATAERTSLPAAAILVNETV